MIKENQNSASVGISETFQEILTYYNLSQSQFAKRCGWKNSEQLSHVLNERSKPSYATMTSVIKTFPELSGDRFLRESGPLFLSELYLNIHESTPNVQESLSENYWKLIADERLITIERQNKQIEFLQNLLIK
jgi:transcriptional regulator with XRE-family HTH domain